MVRKALVKPNIDDIIKGLKENQPLENVILGHLIIESLIVRLIETLNKNNDPWELNFYNKISLCVDNDLIPSNHKSIYLEINKMRNDFAHIFGCKIEYKRLFLLANKMHTNGFDFSDITICTDIDKSFEWYGYKEIVREIFTELYCDLAERLYLKGIKEYI